MRSKISIHSRNNLSIILYSSLFHRSFLLDPLITCYPCSLLFLVLLVLPCPTCHKRSQSYLFLKPAIPQPQQVPGTELFCPIGNHKRVFTHTQTHAHTHTHRERERERERERARERERLYVILKRTKKKTPNTLSTIIIFI